MKNILLTLALVILLGLGFYIGRISLDKSLSKEIRVVDFVRSTDQANHKLYVLKMLRTKKYEEAIGVLEGSMLLDEAVMSKCGTAPSICAKGTENEYSEFRRKLDKYEKEYNLRQ